MAELDADGDGALDFEEFYAWLSNPSRDRAERSSETARLLQAKMMVRYLHRKAKVLKNAVSSAAIRVPADPTVATMGFLAEFGDVGPAGGLRLQLLEPGDRPAKPVEKQSVFTLLLKVKEDAEDADVEAFMEAVDALLDAQGMRVLLEMQGAELSFNYPYEFRGQRYLAIVLAQETEMQQALMAMMQGMDPAAAVGESRFEIAFSKTLSEFFRTGPGVLRDLRFRFDASTKIKLAMLNAMSGIAQVALAQLPEGAVPGPLGSMLKTGYAAAALIREFTLRVRFASIYELFTRLSPDPQEAMDKADAMDGTEFAGSIAGILAGVGAMDETAGVAIRNFLKVVEGVGGLQAWGAVGDFSAFEITGADFDVRARERVCVFQVDVVRLVEGNAVVEREMGEVEETDEMDL